MELPRYDSETVRSELEKLAGRDAQMVAMIPDVRLTAEEANFITDWQMTIGRQAVAGGYPDFSAFPGLALTAQTPDDDPRWKAYHRAYADLRELGEVGRILLPISRGGRHRVSALQLIADDRFPHVRINQAVRGIFWAMVRPDWLQVGWDLPPDEREQASHITILEGSVGDQPAALVFWNVTPSVIRAATDDRLLEMEDKSIGVVAVRQRWAKGNKTIDPAEIRSALYLADKRGVHPEERGTYIADYVLPRRRAKSPLHESEVTAADGRAVNFEELRISQVNGAEPEGPESLLLAKEESRDSEESLSRLYEIADEDERALLDAWKEEFLINPRAKLSDVARRRGWPRDAAEAVRKRLRRKHRSL